MTPYCVPKLRAVIRLCFASPKGARDAPIFYIDEYAPDVGLDPVRVAVGFGFLLVAAAMDWRSRVVKDAIWAALGAVALAIVELDLVLAASPWYLHLMSAATAILYFGVFYGEPIWDDDKGVRLRPARLLLYAIAPFLIAIAGVWSSADAVARGAFWRLLVMPGMIVVAHGLYYLSLLRGGADAKAAMALGLLFPGIYPHVADLPILAPAARAEPLLAVWFPFAFVTIVNAALLFVVIPLGFLAKNLADGTAKIPRAFFGYTAPIHAVPKYVWLLDRVEGGRLIARFSPRRTEDEKADRAEQLRLLQGLGIKKVWVTPKLPFVTAILAGYALAVVVGNPLLALFGLR